MYHVNYFSSYKNSKVISGLKYKHLLIHWEKSEIEANKEWTVYFSGVMCRPHCKFLRKPLNIKLTCVDKKLVWNSRMIYIMYCTGKNCCKNLQISKHCLKYNETEMTITNQWKVFSKKRILCWIWMWTSKTLLKYIMTSKDYTQTVNPL